MRLAALLALALAVPTSAQPRYFDTSCPRLEAGRSDRGFCTTGPTYFGAWFEFAPTADGGSLGLDSLMPLCTAWSLLDPAPTQSGCYDGTTNSVSGGAGPWVTWGSGTSSQTDSLCPNGASCATVTDQRTTSAGGYTTTAAITNNASGWTGCWLGILDNSATTVRLINDSTATPAANFVWEVANISNGLTVSVSSGVTSLTATKAGTVSGALHLACGTWSAAAGIEACLDGACSSGTALASLNSLAAKPTLNGINGAASSSAAMRSLAWVYSSTRLTDAQIATLAHLVLADQPRGISSDGDAGVALALTRAGVRGCPADATGVAGSILPNGRPCITLGGLPTDPGGTNLELQGDAFDNASHVSFVDGGAVAATCVADQAISPWGTLTADRCTFAATSTATQYSAKSQSILTNAASSAGLYAKGQAGDGGTFDVGIELAAGGFTCSPCSYTSAAWTRCKLQNVTSKASGRYAFGNLAGLCDGGTRLSNDVLLASSQAQTGAQLTAYIPTTTASVTLPPEVPSFTISSTVIGSMAITFNPATLTATGEVMGAGTVNDGLQTFMVSATTVRCQYTVGGVPKVLNAPGTVNAGSNRAACAHDGSTITACLNGTCTTTANSFATPSATKLYVGTYPSTGLEDAVTNSNLCFDPSSPRCR